MKYPASLFFCGLLLLAASPLAAQLRLPSILSSGMVLQQNDSVALWGWAGPGEKVYVTSSWSGHTDSAITSNLAKWKLKVKTPAAGGPYEITIRSRNTITLKDVLIGEVWVCSGQSNMEWNFYNGTSDLSADLSLPPNKNIRFFHVPRTGADFPQEDLKAGWAIADSGTIKSFSSVGYFFGKKLQDNLNIPIGLINASWGGTPAETWMPEESVQNEPVLKAAAAKLETFAWWPSAPGKAFNGMIAPLRDFRIAGAIWYQGESNTNTNDSYKWVFTTLIDSWRRHFQKEIPFYYVQIAPFNYGTTNIGALLQEQQTKSMVHPKTGMVVITDLVDNVNDIHPSRKKPVGERLADQALARTYGRDTIVHRYPQLQVVKQMGDKLVLEFMDAEGLRINGPEATGFFLSGETENWVPATVKLEKGQLILSSKELPRPIYVRYGFGNTIIGNISNGAGLPLVPFRTDNWPVEQKPVK